MTEIQHPQPPAKERKHSPHCRRHEHYQNRRHRRQQQEQGEQQPQHRQESGDYDGGGGYQVPQSGLYSVDVEYGYNYTRVGRYNMVQLTFS